MSSYSWYVSDKHKELKLNVQTYSPKALEAEQYRNANGFKCLSQQKFSFYQIANSNDVHVSNSAVTLTKYRYHIIYPFISNMPQHLSHYQVESIYILFK